MKLNTSFAKYYNLFQESELQFAKKSRVILNHLRPFSEGIEMEHWAKIG